MNWTNIFQLFLGIAIIAALIVIFSNMGGY
jgi:hypothetical protein